MTLKGAPTAIDLFCGAGGLTLGLKRAGFKVVAGIEIDSEIAKTYRANHPDVKLLEKDLRCVTGKEILRSARVRKIALVAGCPPCQGFSKLTDKYHKEDPRNDLILEMARIVKEIEPKMVMMENVFGLATRGKPMLDEFIRILKSMGYSVTYDVLQLADYGIPQSRRRLVLLAGKGFVIDLPKPTHHRIATRHKGDKPWVEVERIIRRLDRPLTLSRALRKGGPRKLKWHVVRDLKDISRRRLKALRSGQDRKSLPKELRPSCHTNSDEGFPNVYGRLKWNQIAPTITSGCTTPCKGRFGHPSQLRTISLLEAALIQTFPKSYKFDTEFMGTACTLVGNALPPMFAKIVGKACLNALDN